MPISVGFGIEIYLTRVADSSAVGGGLGPGEADDAFSVPQTPHAGGSIGIPFDDGKGRSHSLSFNGNSAGTGGMANSSMNVDGAPRSRSSSHGIANSHRSLVSALPEFALPKTHAGRDSNPTASVF